MSDVLDQTINYLLDNMTDPFPQYILKKEVLNLSADDLLLTNIRKSKWYCQLAGEQREDGSWGRFHSMDSSVRKNKFVSTEAALRRARELALTKDDPMIAKSVALMESYLKGEGTWPDYVEKHHDNGKSHLHSRFYLTAANLNLFDPQNPLLIPFREVCIKQLETAFAADGYNDEAWQKANLDYSGTCLNAWTVYPLWLLQNTDCLDDDLQRKYLNYIWNRKEGIYYISNSTPAKKLYLEDKGFTTWLSALEALSGFSLFAEVINTDVYHHLISEIGRLMSDEVLLPPARPITGHYSESWRDKDVRMNDMILRIVRILIKGGGKYNDNRECCHTRA